MSSIEATMADLPRHPLNLRHHSEGGIDDDMVRRNSKALDNLNHRFALVESTEDHFRSLDDDKFYGSYGHLRKKLDYSYHRHYRKDRQWLHDSIIDDILVNGSYKASNRFPITPWIILTVGAQGAGKRHVISSLIRSRRLPILSTVFVDADEIRRLLPEFPSLVAVDPRLVGCLTQKESGYISETLAWAALQQGRNMILDSCLKDAAWYQKLIRQFRLEFNGVRVAMFYVQAHLETIVKRGRHVSMDSGRVIQRTQLEQIVSHIPDSLNVVKPDVDFFCVIDNEEAPELLDCSWSTFQELFDQNGFSLLPTPELRRMGTADAMPDRSACTRRRFSVVRSSEENHRSDDMTFFGQFAHIRQVLDYSYHSNYTFERQRFQDAIVNEFLNSAVITDENGFVCATPNEPWLVFTAGAMGAGKSYTMRCLSDRGLFPLSAFVRVDPDEIRRYMPEFQLYVKQSPELAGELTRKEAGFIAEILTLAALLARRNVLVDGSLRDATWYQSYFEVLRRDFPDLRLAIIHVTAPRECVFQRAAERAVATGRIVPRETIIRALEQVPKSVAVLKRKVDYFVELYNAGEIELVEPPNETWLEFQLAWIQTCAFRLSKSTSMASSLASLN